MNNKFGLNFFRYKGNLYLPINNLPDSSNKFNKLHPRTSGSPFSTEYPN